MMMKIVFLITYLPLVEAIIQQSYKHRNGTVEVSAGVTLEFNKRFGVTLVLLVVRIAGEYS